MENENKGRSLDCEASAEQVRYADMLFWGAWIAIAIMVATYVIYVAGVIEPYIPLTKITEYWSQPVDTYVHKAHVPIGWGWVSLLGKGDFLNFIGLSILATMTILCFLVALLPAYVKKKEWLFVGVVVLEVAVLVLAASGILGGGGH